MIVNEGYASEKSVYRVSDHGQIENDNVPFILAPQASPCSLQCCSVTDHCWPLGEQVALYMRGC